MKVEFFIAFESDADLGQTGDRQRRDRYSSRAARARRISSLISVGLALLASVPLFDLLTEYRMDGFEFTVDDFANAIGAMRSWRSAVSNSRRCDLGHSVARSRRDRPGVGDCPNGLARNAEQCSLNRDDCRAVVDDDQHPEGRVARPQHVARWVREALGQRCGMRIRRLPGGYTWENEQKSHLFMAPYRVACQFRRCGLRSDRAMAARSRGNSMARRRTLGHFRLAKLVDSSNSDWTAAIDIGGA